jgi:death-on-curing protein
LCITNFLKHGAASGIRDETLPRFRAGKASHIFSCGRPELFTLTTANIAGIVRNHPFANGNKQTALLAAAIFLERHGTTFTAPDEEVSDFRPAPPTVESGKTTLPSGFRNALTKEMNADRSRRNGKRVTCSGMPPQDWKG